MTDTPTTTRRPEQPDGIEHDTTELPEPARAAERVRAYLSAWGDGLRDVADGHPLYARDLESVARAVLDARQQATDTSLTCVRCGQVESYPLTTAGKIASLPDNAYAYIYAAMPAAAVVCEAYLECGDREAYAQQVTRARENLRAAIADAQAAVREIRNARTALIDLYDVEHAEGGHRARDFAHFLDEAARALRVLEELNPTRTNPNT